MDQYQDGEDDESVQVLRLHSWRPSPLPISRFKEASLSPCRDMLSVLSDNKEVMLIPLQLIAENVSGSSYVPPPPPPPTAYVPPTTPVKPNLGSAPSVPFPSSPFATSAGSGLRTLSTPASSYDSLQSVQTPLNTSSISKSFVIPKNLKEGTLTRSSSVNPRSFPCITDVLSYCWGSNHDGYGAAKQLGLFKELLFVVGEKGLVIHAFPDDTHKQENHNDVMGAYRKQPSDVSTRSKHVSGRWMNWGAASVDEPSDASAQNHMPCNGDQKESQKSFITFSVDAHMQLNADCVELNFFQSNIMNTANGKVVSFSIFYGSRGFSALAEFCKPVNQAGAPMFKFGKMFSGPSFDMLGMILLEERDLSNPSEREDQTRGMLFVLICKVLHSGVKWFSVIEPQKASKDQRSFHHAIFAIAGRYLFGLQEGGDVHMWTLTDGNVVAHFDVLRHCQFPLSSPDYKNSLLDQETEKGGYVTSANGLRSLEKEYAKGQSGKFVQMVVDADCSLVAVMDSSGVIYLISTKSYIQDSSHRSNLEAGASPRSCLSSWAVGATDIGAHLYLRENSSVNVFQPIEEISSSCSSGFCSRWNLSRGVREVRFKRCFVPPLRGLILPIEHRSTHYTLCLSKLGITMIEDSKGVVKMLCLSGKSHDDRNLISKHRSGFLREAQLDHKEERRILTFCSQGCLHFVSESGLFVVLPPLSLQTCERKGGTAQARWWSTGAKCDRVLGDLQCEWRSRKPGPMLQPWQIEVLDKALTYDGLQAAEHLAAENGWCQQLVRLRRLQLALTFSQLEETEQALDDLIPVGAAEIGIPRMLFSALELMRNKASGDNELAHASRLLSLAACFVTKLIHQYGLEKWSHKTKRSLGSFSKLGCISNASASCRSSWKNLDDISHFLAVIRKLQNQLQLRRRPSPGKKEAGDEIPSDQGVSSDNAVEKVAGGEEVGGANHATGSLEDLMWLVKSGAEAGNQTFESSGEMFFRWEKEKVELAGIVREALRAGRLPLAVVQLHHLQSKDLSYHVPGQNAFKEVQSIGRAFVYELFCKGETEKAMTVLSRLGEDPEAVLHELAFGTVSRFLRSQVIKELARLNCLDLRDMQILQTVSLLERAYPNSSFWGSYGAQQRLLPDPTAEGAKDLQQSDAELQLVCSVKNPMDLTIACGEIDGVVLGCWDNTAGLKSVELVSEEPVCGYWAGAAVWLTAWDQRTLFRVISDYDRSIEGELIWEACLQKAISCHDWIEVSSLLESIPESVLQEGCIRVRLDCVDKFDLYTRPSQSERLADGKETREGLDGLEIDAVELVIPRVRILEVTLENVCTGWMSQMMEEKLAQSHIFFRSYWHGTKELLSLLARAGVLFENSARTSLHNMSFYMNKKHHTESLQPMHELVLHHCVRYSLPHFMALYLDYHSLALDNVSSVLMQAVVGDCQWALWLLFSRIKGREYDASFANARTVLAHNFSPAQLHVALDNDEFILTVDDMAMVGGEMMALSTLMYAPVALEKCLCTGSVNRQDGPTWQCTLENLRPGLQRFPTLWCTLLSACFSPDTWCFTTTSLSRAALSPRSKQGLPGYLQWRDQLFSSACGDTSVLQMMPRWFPKGVRRLLQLAVQGHIGGGLQSGSEHLMNHAVDDVDPISWETALQKSIEEELYASSKFEDKAMGIEHHLRRGRAMAAFNSFLALRLQNFSPQGSVIREHVGKFQRGGQLHMSSELHALLSPLTSQEEKYLCSVLPLAIINYDNPVVVAACSSFLELCGVPATMLRVDVAVLLRISSFCKVREAEQLNGAGAGASLPDTQVDRSNIYRSDVAASLARALADEYVETGVAVLIVKKADTSGKRAWTGKLNQTLMNVLQKLEKASCMDWGKQEGSPGSWLWNGVGDGPQLRIQQREASERWSLVTMFCNIHQLPISTLYLASLARDNDWVGFLAEAQLEGCPLEILISVAHKEFTDTRLQSHILTVLKSSQAAWQKQGPSTKSHPSLVAGSHLDSSIGSVGIGQSELFRILAECEHKKHPGTALLIKAKDLRWPLLAIIASCFMDVTPVSCLTVWLEISAARETSLIKVNDAAAHLAACVGAAVEATNALSSGSHVVDFRYNRKNPKRRRVLLSEKIRRDSLDPTSTCLANDESLENASSNLKEASSQSGKFSSDLKLKSHHVPGSVLPQEGPEEQESLSSMIAILCEQHLFFPLLKAFELFMPSSPLLPFIRFLQAFAQMRLLEASAHLTLFTASLKDEAHQIQYAQNRNKSSTAWITIAAVTAADTMLATCPSSYERRCLLHLLAGADFGDGGAAAVRFRRLYWKIQFAEPALQQGTESISMGSNLGDDDLLSALEKQGKWEEARSWARQLELSGQHGKTAAHHVTETQAEAMAAEWREFLWDIPEERIALWNHCQALFMRYSFPPQQAGSFFLKHAEAVEQEVPSTELHGLLLLALQWLSGSITNTSPVYPLHLLRELETRIWLLAVESEVEMREAGTQKPLLGNYPMMLSQKPGQDLTLGLSGGRTDYINHTAKAVVTVDNHLKNSRVRITDYNSHERETRQPASNDPTHPSVSGEIPKFKRRPRNYAQHKKIQHDRFSKPQVEQDGSYPGSPLKKADGKGISQEDAKEDGGVGEEPTYWEEKVGEQELERAVISLLEVGQISAARQLQQKLAPVHVPIELLLVEAALSFAMLSKPTVKGCIDSTILHPAVMECITSSNLIDDISSVSPLELLEVIAKICREGCGRGICRRIITVVQVAKLLDMLFSEAFEKQPAQLLQLLSLKAQDSLQEAKLLVDTHSIPAASIARILAESFLKGLLAAHRGGYMDSSQREEGPAPLLWRPSDFLKWGKLCPSEPELGHALMRLVISGHDVPHACEVELLILAHHFYMSSACLDGIDVLLALAATRVESYISEGDFVSLARLVTGINNFQALHFMLDILIENGQLELLLQKRAGVEAAMESSTSVRGFRMAVLSTLKHFNPDDLDACATVYDQFDMKHEMALLLESRAQKGLGQWLVRHDPEQSEELLEMMRYNVEAAEVWSGIDAGNKARWNCAQASLIALQLRMPEISWLCLSETNARRLFVDQSRFQEALVVAEAYKLNQPGEWAPVLWDQMLHHGFDQFLGEFVAALPLSPNMLMELSRFYRAEVTARGDQLDFSTWLSPGGGMPPEWARNLGKSFRCLLKYVRDVRLRVQLATLATRFPDVLDVCMRILDKVPDTAGPLILRKGHGGTYLPLM